MMVCVKPGRPACKDARVDLLKRTGAMHDVARASEGRRSDSTGRRPARTSHLTGPGISC